jgi:hypothetical protein
MFALRAGGVRSEKTVEVVWTGRKIKPGGLK